MSNERVLFQTARLSVKESAQGFQFLERQGKDSLAIFLVRRVVHEESEYEILIRHQPLCIDNPELGETPKLYPCSITGSIDNDELLEEAAIREVLEETGYAVQVLPLGRYIVGTQTNEICYLYYADVTGVEPDMAKQDGSYFESISQNQWHPLEYLQQCEYAACQIGYYRLQAILFGNFSSGSSAS